MAAQENLLPHQLLFLPRDFKGLRRRGPLFKNQSDLASEIARSEGPYHGKVNTVRSLLSQVMRHGGDKNRRSLPDKLRAAILTAIKERVTQEFDLNAFEELLDRSFEDLSHERRYGDAIPTQELESEMLSASDAASRHYIVTRRPAELERNEFGQRLAKQMLENILDKNVKYSFYFSEKGIVQRFWAAVRRRMQGLLEERQENMGGTEQVSGPSVDALISEINRARRLQVFHNKDLRHFLHPYVILQYDEDNMDHDDLKGYVLHYHDESGVSISRMRREDVRFWEEKEFPHLTNPTNPDTLKEYEYAAILPTLQQIN